MSTTKLFQARCLVLMVAAFLFTSHANAQSVSSFENLILPADSFWDGSDMSGGFSSGAGFFVNHFTDWGGGFTSWDGFAYANRIDTTTPGYGNQYSAYAGGGFEGSPNFAVGYCYPTTRIRLPDNIHQKVTSGLYVTNNTYCALSMRDGDSFSKKFGGGAGNDPDWFRLSIWGYTNGLPTDTVAFYLADYRFSDNDSDYIVKDWTYIDLAGIGDADSLEFSLSSSDNDSIYGMRTPAYFCIDNVTVDFLPDSETGTDSLFLNACGPNYFNLDTFFVDIDTPDSLLSYEIIYNSEPWIFIADIAANILTVFVSCPVKSTEMIYHDTIVVRAHSPYGYYDVAYHFVADIIGNVSLSGITTFNFYPNPAGDFLFINTTGINDFRIYDPAGRTVLKGEGNNVEKIDISWLSPGMYLISCNGNIQKFIKN